MSKTCDVKVQLKLEVLDTEARAISETLKRNGFDKISNVKIAKVYTLEFSEEVSDSAKLQQATTIAKEFLSNPVSQTFEVSN